MNSLLKGTAFITGAASGMCPTGQATFRKSSSSRVFERQWLRIIEGIGQYTAYGLAAHGIKRLTLADINSKALRTTVEELKQRYADVDVKAIELDVSNEKSVEEGIRETVSTFGSIDIAVNNAGIAGLPMPTHEVPISDWNRVLNVNLTGVWMCQRAQIQQMLKQE